MYKKMVKLVTHLVPIDAERFEATKKDLEEMFADEKHGDIGSVLGGQDVQIFVEEEAASHWPKEKPRYE